MFLLRLDDASENMDQKKWMRVEELLDRYGIKPIVGVIAINKDPELLQRYSSNLFFWNTVKNWEQKGWCIAMHGCYHLFQTKEGGLNPVNKYSEFAGQSYEKQLELIKTAKQVFESHQLNPKVFFAPAHTFDTNTLKALHEATDIRIINDTIANDVYYDHGFYFLPQQTGKVRKLPFKLVTCCYHPNNMRDEDYLELESFLKKYKGQFLSIQELEYKKRRKSLVDLFLNKLYFGFRKFRERI